MKRSLVSTGLAIAVGGAMGFAALPAAAAEEGLGAAKTAEEKAQEEADKKAEEEAAEKAAEEAEAKKKAEEEAAEKAAEDAAAEEAAKKKADDAKADDQAGAEKKADDQAGAEENADEDTENTDDEVSVANIEDVTASPSVSSGTAEDLNASGVTVNLTGFDAEDGEVSVSSAVSGAPAVVDGAVSPSTGTWTTTGEDVTVDYLLDLADDYVGTLTFTYTLTADDGSSETVTTTVTVEADDQDQEGTATATPSSATAEWYNTNGLDVTIEGLGTEEDPVEFTGAAEGEGLPDDAFSSSPENLTAFGEPVTIEYDVNLPEDYEGTITFTYSSADGVVATTSITVEPAEEETEPLVEDDDDEEASERALLIEPAEVSSRDFVDQDKGVHIVASGFEPGEIVTLEIAAGPSSVEGLTLDQIADEDGVAHYNIYGVNADNPGIYVGDYRVTVTGADDAADDEDPLTGSFSVIGKKSGNAGGSSDSHYHLPRTGADFAGVGMGVALLVAGVGAVLLSTRRAKGDNGPADL